VSIHVATCGITSCSWTSPKELPSLRDPRLLHTPSDELFAVRRVFVSEFGSLNSFFCFQLVIQRGDAGKITQALKERVFNEHFLGHLVVQQHRR
jgi:hypothetical protein